MLVAAIVVGVALVLYGAPVPRLSEELYLPLVRRTGDAAYLAGDWTTSGPFGEHWVFDHLLGPVAARMPLPWFGWIGRLLSWTILAVLLVRLGSRFGLSPGLAGVGLGLWLVANQSLIGSDWMFGTFEAKSVAYCFLVGAILLATGRRVPPAIALLGLAVSFHPGVGGWGALAAGTALLVDRETRAQALRWAPVGLILAAPGAIAIATNLGTTTLALQRFLVLDAIPHHADPFFGGAQLPALQLAARTGVLVAMLAANVVWYRASGRSGPQRFLLVFQLAAMAPVPLAFIARAFHLWPLLVLQPLRLGPLVVPLCFFLQLVGRVHRQRADEAATIAWWRRRSVALATVGVLIATFVTSPVLAAPRMVARTVRSWVDPSDEVDAFAWIRDNTPTTMRCVVPVDRQDAFMLAERPIVGNWQAVRYDALADWKRRVDALVGGADTFERESEDLVALRAAYDELTVGQITAIAREYDASCIVATTRYPLPLLHRSGRVRIYRSPAEAAP